MVFWWSSGYWSISRNGVAFWEVSSREETFSFPLPSFPPAKHRQGGWWESRPHPGSDSTGNEQTQSRSSGCSPAREQSQVQSWAPHFRENSHTNITQCLGLTLRDSDITVYHSHVEGGTRQQEPGSGTTSPGLCSQENVVRLVSAILWVSVPEGLT